MEDQKEIERAVEIGLLPTLPNYLKQRAKYIPFYQLFLAIDGVAKLLIRTCRRLNVKYLCIAYNGDVINNGKVILPWTTLKGEIVRCSKVQLQEAKEIVRWIIEACDYNHNLFLGGNVLYEDGMFWFSQQERDNTTNLIDYWRYNASTKSI